MSFLFYLFQCSHPCGRKGRQIRKVYCHDAIGKKVARFYCPIEYKPQRKRKCNQRRCGPVTCLEIQKRLKATTDGEYPLLIGGRNMTIYCHGMSSIEPREYLTLSAGDSENYAEIYDKRLVNQVLLFSQITMYYRFIDPITIHFPYFCIHFIFFFTYYYQFIKGQVYNTYS